MLTEHKLRHQMESIWRMVGSPIRKAREFLKISQCAKALGTKLMDVGFSKHHEGDRETSRKLWAAAETMLSISETARRDAKAALEGKDSVRGFEYAPADLAVPKWERESEPGGPIISPAANAKAGV